MSTFWRIFAIILGEAEQIVPVFIHNPKSQQIEGIIVTSVNHAVEALASQPQAQSGSTGTTLPININVSQAK